MRKRLEAIGFLSALGVLVEIWTSCHQKKLCSFVGSMEAPSKAFLLFFLLPDWLKLNHLKSEWNVVFQKFFRVIFVPP